MKPEMYTQDFTHMVSEVIPHMHGVFEINPKDDERRSCEVRFTSRVTLEKFVASARLLPSNGISDIYKLMKEHPAMKPCAKAMFECKLVPRLAPGC
jgi:hypothetical protein